MLRRFGRIFAWFLVGLAGTVVIVASWFVAVRAAVPVHLRSGGFVETKEWDQGVVTASGTWVVENDRQAFPLQITELTCVRSEEKCRSATAEIAFNLLTVKSEDHGIVRWSDDAIVFASTTAPCADYTYTISRPNPRVVGTSSPKNAQDATCATSSQGGALQLSLQDGSSVSRRLEEEAGARYQPLMWIALAALWIFVTGRIIRRPRSRVRSRR